MWYCTASLLVLQDQMRLGVFAPRFYRARSINFLLKSVHPPEALTSFSQGLNPTELIKASIHLTTYRSGRLLLNEVKKESDLTRNPTTN